MRFEYLQYPRHYLMLKAYNAIGDCKWLRIKRELNESSLEQKFVLNRYLKNITFKSSHTIMVSLALVLISELYRYRLGIIQPCFPSTSGLSPRISFSFLFAYIVHLFSHYMRLQSHGYSHSHITENKRKSDFNCIFCCRFISVHLKHYTPMVVKVQTEKLKKKIDKEDAQTANKFTANMFQGTERALRCGLSFISPARSFSLAYLHQLFVQLLLLLLLSSTIAWHFSLALICKSSMCEHVTVLCIHPNFTSE